MEKARLMQETITKQRQLPNEIKDKLSSITFFYLIISIAFMIYMIVENLLFINGKNEIFLISTRASLFIFVIVDIIIFEISYRKENMSLAVQAIELFSINLFILVISYIYFYTNPVIKSIVMFAPIYLSIYFVGKVIIIYIIEKNRYINNLSDVQEILRDDSEEKQ